MKKTFGCIAMLTVALGACKNESSNTTGDFKSDREKFAYSLGMDIAHNLEKAKVDSLDVETMAQAISDVLSKKDLKLSDEQANTVIREYFQKKQVAENAEKIQKGKKFLDDNKKKAGVTTTQSGLQYEIIKAGTGPKPTINDKVKVFYEGKLVDGTVFDKTSPSDPAIFPVGNVIAGWTEALQLMPVGSKWKLVVPSNLAYGETGVGGAIGPNETLIFEVELLGIEK
ncbi:MAG TPA: FKBP-type peptidyl-prolyl cis-trans isomerase [Luteibaculaceae bacterium]|nr:FKBP-type peptidyl-prolyl cis-trans isomerase [Luteibaculaceae bacterium]